MEEALVLAPQQAAEPTADDPEETGVGQSGSIENLLFVFVRTSSPTPLVANTDDNASLSQLESALTKAGTSRTLSHSCHHVMRILPVVINNWISKELIP